MLKSTVIHPKLMYKITISKVINELWHKRRKKTTTMKFLLYKDKSLAAFPCNLPFVATHMLFFADTSHLLTILQLDSYIDFKDIF